MTPAFQNFIQPAHPRIEIWRVLITLGIWFLLYLGLSTAVLAGLGLYFSAGNPEQFLGGKFDTPIQMLVLFSTFVMWMIVLN